MIDISCAGKAGMQIGSAREAIIIALPIYKFGEQNVRRYPDYWARSPHVIVTQSSYFN